MKTIERDEKVPPRVTIVTPAYNQAAYVTQTVQSVLSQSFPKIEYIVIDDGSTDDTSQRLEKYEHEIELRKQSNSGQARTLNVGWSSANGELLGYLSSDDLYHPLLIEKMVDALDRDKGAVVAYCDFSLIDEEGRTLRTINTEEFSRRRLTEDLICFPGPGAIFRRSAYEKCGGWDPSLRQAPDLDFWLKMSDFGHFIRVPEVLASSRIHAGSASYRPISTKRAKEIIVVAARYWSGKDPRCAARSMARAYVVSSALHFQSRRFGAGTLAMLRALLFSPAVALRRQNLRSAAGGLMRGVTRRFAAVD